MWDDEVEETAENLRAGTSWRPFFQLFWPRMVDLLCLENRQNRSYRSFVGQSKYQGVLVLFLAGNCAEEAIYCPHREGGKIAQNRTLTNVDRRHFGICGRFSAVRTMFGIF